MFKGKGITVRRGTDKELQISLVPAPPKRVKNEYRGDKSKPNNDKASETQQVRRRRMILSEESEDSSDSSPFSPPARTASRRSDVTPGSGRTKAITKSKIVKKTRSRVVESDDSSSSSDSSYSSSSQSRSPSPAARTASKRSDLRSHRGARDDTSESDRPSRAISKSKRVEETRKRRVVSSDSSDSSPPPVVLQRGSTSSKRTASSSRKHDLPVVPGIQLLTKQILFDLIIEPHATQREKLNLGMVSKSLKRLINQPTSWKHLDLSCCCVGQVSRRGRAQVQTETAISLVAKRVMAQSRYAQITSVNLSTLLLGASDFHSGGMLLLSTLFQCCPNVVSLDLTGTRTSVKGEWGWKKNVLVQLCPGLRHLTVSHLSNNDIGVLLKSCSDLERLVIKEGSGWEGSHYPNDVGMMKFEAGAKKLKCFHLTGRPVTVAGVKALLKGCPSLEDVQFTDCKRLNNEAVDELNPFLSSIKKWRIGDAWGGSAL